jgi:hypothetical protein
MGLWCNSGTNNISGTYQNEPVATLGTAFIRQDPHALLSGTFFLISQKRRWGRAKW